MHSAGVYEIVNTVSGKRYIGSAVSFKERWRIHVREMARGKHHNPALQSAWNKLGAEGLTFRPLFVCAKQDLLFYEQRAIDVLRPEYNVCRVAGSALGVKRSAEVRAKASEAARRRSPEHNAKIALAMLGTKASQETRAKQSALRMGNQNGANPSPETRAKIAAAQRGKTHSAETRAKMAASHAGKPRSPEVRQRMSAWLSGRKLTAEHRANLSAAATGRTWSAEDRAKMSANRKGRSLTAECRANISAAKKRANAAKRAG